jgi:hypothetical protein
MVLHAGFAFTMFRPGMEIGALFGRLRSGQADQARTGDRFWLRWLRAFRH